MKSRLHHAPKVSTRKCVRIVGQGIPGSFSNEDAHRLVVIDKDAEYCPKSVLKEWRKSYPSHPAHFRVNSQNQIVPE